MPVAARPVSIFASSAVEPFQPLLMIAQRRLQLVAPRGEIGELAGERGKGFLRGGERGFGNGDALVDAAKLCGARPALRT